MSNDIVERVKQTVVLHLGALGVQPDSSSYQETEPKFPRIFNYLVALVLGGTMLSIGVAILAAPYGNLAYYFVEGQFLTVLSSMMLSMAGALALVIFYVRIQRPNIGVLFWLFLGSALIFLALDESLQFHERVGALFGKSFVGKSSHFRNWNDVIVIGYGVGAIVFLWIFKSEITRCQKFLQLLVIAFVFYVIHTTVDSIVVVETWLKVVPEESAKILSVAFLLLAVCANLLVCINGMIENRSA